MNRQSRKIQTGFSLVELAAAAAVFSMGLGSLSMLMLASINGTSQARHQTVGTTQASSMAEMIATSSDAYGHYINPPAAGPGDCHVDFCDSEEMAAANLAFWQVQLRNELPDGSGLVCRDSTPNDGSAEDPQCDGTGAVVIKIFWMEPHGNNAENGGAKRLVSRLPW
jgi:type IV pilus assembly protein PilV